MAYRSAVPISPLKQLVYFSTLSKAKRFSHGQEKCLDTKREFLEHNSLIVSMFELSS